jgi:hypothetical protein
MTSFRKWHIINCIILHTNLPKDTQGSILRLSDYENVMTQIVSRERFSHRTAAVVVSKRNGGRWDQKGKEKRKEIMNAKRKREGKEE